MARLVAPSLSRCWAMGGVAGAIAGVLVAPAVFLDTNMMGSLLIKAFTAACWAGCEPRRRVPRLPRARRAGDLRRRLPVAGVRRCAWLPPFVVRRCGRKACWPRCGCARYRGRSSRCCWCCPGWCYGVYLLSLTGVFSLVAIGLNLLAGLAGPDQPGARGVSRHRRLCHRAAVAARRCDVAAGALLGGGDCRRPSARTAGAAVAQPLSRHCDASPRHRGAEDAVRVAQRDRRRRR